MNKNFKYIAFAMFVLSLAFSTLACENAGDDGQLLPDGSYANNGVDAAADAIVNSAVETVSVMPTEITIVPGEIEACAALAQTTQVNSNPFGSKCDQIRWAQESGVAIVVK